MATAPPPCGVGRPLGAGRDRDPSNLFPGRRASGGSSRAWPIASHWETPQHFPLQLLPQSQHFIPPARSFTTTQIESHLLCPRTPWLLLVPQGPVPAPERQQNDTTRLSAARGQPHSLLHAADAQFSVTFLPNLSGRPPSSGVLALTPGEGAGCPWPAPPRQGWWCTALRPQLLAEGAACEAGVWDECPVSTELLQGGSGGREPRRLLHLLARVQQFREQAQARATERDMALSTGLVRPEPTGGGTRAVPRAGMPWL